MSEDSGNEQRRSVVKIILHEEYDSREIINDIALLKIEPSLDFNPYVSPIGLPEQLESFEGSCTISGWGTLSSGGILPDALQYVDVPLVSDDECRKAYGDSDVVDSMICAGEEGKDSCQGDSGGPMACDEKLAGITSWGKGCGWAGYPGVYTEVSYFVDWILANL